MLPTSIDGFLEEKKENQARGSSDATTSTHYLSLVIMDLTSVVQQQCTSSQLYLLSLASGFISFFFVRIIATTDAMVQGWNQRNYIKL
jgi:hypothetical protein